MSLPQEDNQRPYKCEFCEKSFRRLQHKVRHVRGHTGETPYKCTFRDCDERFTRSDELKRHERSHTSPYDTSFYRKGRYLNDESEKADYLRQKKHCSVLRLKPFSRGHDNNCSINPSSTLYYCTMQTCRKSFLRKGLLLRHLRIQHGIIMTDFNLTSPLLTPLSPSASPSPSPPLSPQTPALSKLTPISEEETSPNFVYMPDLLGKTFDASQIYLNYEKESSEPLINYETVSHGKRKFSEDLFSADPLVVSLPPLQNSLHHLKLCGAAGHPSQASSHQFSGYTLPSLKSLFSN